MPWLGPGFVYTVHEDALRGLRSDLAKHGFNAIVLDGSEMRDAASFHAEAKKAFAFPDYYGNNWDAFNECFGEIHFPNPTAILWREVETLARADLKTFAEAVAQFIRLRDAFARADAEAVEASEPIQIELIIVGRGPGFRHPDDPIDSRWRLPH